MTDIRPGLIVCIYIATIKPPKDKFGLIAHIDHERDTAALFLIHSELPKFIQSSPELIKGVTKISKEAHSFLDYDSWIRFGDVHSCRYSEIVREIGGSPERAYGYASDELLRNLLRLIPNCPELSERWKQRYCVSLSQFVVDAGNSKSS